MHISPSYTLHTKLDSISRENCGGLDCPIGFTRIFFLHENIHATRVVQLSTKELDTMFESSLTEIP